MSADILAFDRTVRAEKAWERYAELARMVQADTSLLTDLEHMTAMALAHAEWEKLYLSGVGK